LTAAAWQILDRLVLGFVGDGRGGRAAFSHDREVRFPAITPAIARVHMSKKVVLVAGILLAAGAVAAISVPSLRGQRHGSLIDDLTDGVGRATQQISQAIGVSDEAAPTREERRIRRAKQRRGDEERADAAQAAVQEDSSKPSREARGKGLRGKERVARQDEDDGDVASDAGAKRERRWAEHDRGEPDDEGREPRRRAAWAAQDRYGQSFGRLDKNGDGAIDMSEFVLAETERIAARARAFFKRFDADGDGKVTREEFGRGSRERFTALDADDTGDAAQGARSRAAVK
jgi:EF-hand domain pair